MGIWDGDEGLGVSWGEREDFININLLVLLMQVVTPTKKGSFKQKKSSILQSSPASDFQTPIKTVAAGAQEESVTHRRVTSMLISNSQASGPEMPTNALKKRCFQKGRQIRSIQQLQPLYQTRLLSKSNYRFKREEKRDRSNSSARKKSIADRLPCNILATECSLGKRSRVRGQSVSRLIKNSIIRGQ